MINERRILTKEDSFSLVKKFLRSNGLGIDINEYLKKLESNPIELVSLPQNLVESVIFDGYDYSKNIRKNIVSFFEKKFNIILGNVLKRSLKKYLDYRELSFFDQFYSFFVKNYGDYIKKDELLDIINKFVESEKYGKLRRKSIENYFDNLNKAIQVNDKSRIYDYLNFIYSRVINFNELSRISLKYLFNINQDIIKKEFDNEEYLKLKNYCNNNELQEREVIIQNFNRKYISILEERGNYDNKYSLVIFNITKKIFNNFDNKESFYSFIFSTVKKIYELIQNHRTLIVKIENIIENEVNLKWEIFSYLIIFAEKFIKQIENRAYYKPEEIVADTIQNLYKLKILNNEFDLIKKYYRKKVKIGDLNPLNVGKIENFETIFDDFKYIYTGFTFNDCFILKNQKGFSEQSRELKFIRNNNELLLIFTKHKFNDAKIPCPICGSLNISGNSFPKIGIRSWECKNPLCAERSKTNRGKRYSERTIFMQDSTLDFSKENLISREIINLWRRDVVEINKIEDIFKMAIKYYSFENDNILFIDDEKINQNINENLSKISIEEKRYLIIDSILNFLPLDKYEKRLYHDFFESSNYSYINHFILHHFLIDIKGYNKDFDFIYKFNRKIKLIHGDCFKVLQNIKNNSINCMVTSPPYYNAREYSQWPNLYCYLNEMYKIIQVVFNALKSGGIFLFNIGDIYGNDNITVKSKMGERRIPLGSYLILLFIKAGFQIIENIIWDKGEAQSNRFKNDGNFSPYYQRPANCYEHIFIFKKIGAPLTLNKEIKKHIWDSNIACFSPVIKIGVNGENRYGHSAPFPPEIPLFAITTFTDEGDIVLDPFSGSLTSAIVACTENRIGVGIELLEEYIKLSFLKAKEKNYSIELYSKKLDSKEILKELHLEKSHFKIQYNMDKYLK